MEEEIGLREYLAVIARRWKIIAIVFFAAIAAGAIFTFEANELCLSSPHWIDKGMS